MAKYASTVIKIALAEVGYLEKKSNKNLDSKTANAGSANYTKYGRDMHKLYPSVMDFPAAWCDCFVDWCFQKAFGVSNAKGLLGGNFNDYTPASAQLYKNKKAWGNTPKIGAQIFFKNDTRICHTGLVYDFDDKHVYTVEGNTSGASGVVANGGGVCKKKYARNNSRIAGYGYPKYDTEKKETEKKETEKTDTAKKVTATGTADHFKENLAGTYVTTGNLNMRDDAGSANKSLVVIPKGTEVKCYGYYSLSKGVNWLYVQVTINKVQYTGFCSKSYLKKK